MAHVTILDDRTADRKLLRQAREEILRPSFPKEQYVDDDDAPHVGPLLVAVSDSGLTLGIAVGEIFSASDALLGYLAVRPGYRGQNVGNALMTAIVQQWLTDGRQWFIEVDDPRHYPSREDHGDPAARLRFYHRFGVVAIPIPYFQPRLAPTLDRGAHMILGIVPPAGVHPRAVSGASVRAFLEVYFAGCEGPGALSDDDLVWLLRWCEVDELPLIPLDDLRHLPDADPPSATTTA
jgi:GNAT superfamily N-acetyltransferase